MRSRVGVQIRRVHATVDGTVLHTAREHPRGLVVSGECDCGAVEFVPHGAIADGV
jgi:hypothetical protein